MYSFSTILTTWSQARYLNSDVALGSYQAIAIVSVLIAGLATIAAITVSKRYGAKTIIESIGPKYIVYQLWMFLLFARSCHVWVFTVTNQRIINACGHLLTLGAPIAINTTCLCDGVIVEQHHFPFVTGDTVFTNTTCSPWVLDDTAALQWSVTWETIVFSGFLTHLLTNAIARNKEPSPMLLNDAIACITASQIAFIPYTYYSVYNVGGIFRFVGLMHALAPLENICHTRRLVGVIVVLKLTFISMAGAALMFIAEKPCQALYEVCDEGFNQFGDTLYFIFVTLSTVGYGDMAPKTEMGKIGIVFIIMASISYLPNIIADFLPRTNPLQDRLDEIHQYLRQVGGLDRGRKEKDLYNGDIELQSLLDV